MTIVHVGYGDIQVELSLPDEGMGTLNAAGRQESRYPYRFLDNYGRRPIGLVGR